MAGVLTPIDRYLAEQQESTAVERFSRRHDEGLLDAALLAPGLYADRLPVNAPRPDEQLAFRVDLDQCTGCKSCVAACHSLNGLDEGESWRSVGQLVGGGASDPSVQTVPSGCHHCVDPACLSGCPTNAYEKDPFSGIVRHLDDQCFGCGYCELTCPYEVPRLNERLGVVRKCDMCADRLAEGEAPACVQACPTSAITITVVDTQQVVASSQGSVLVPGAPDSAITSPTTQYVSVSPLPEDLLAADRHALHPSKAHPPLAFMLVLTQMSVGLLLATLLSGGPAGDRPASMTVVAALVGLLALGGAFFHLGRPLVAWRAVLGVGHSWFSREVLAFGVYAFLVSGYATAVVLEPEPNGFVTVAGAAAGVAGVIGVGCSGLIYVATRRTWWRGRYTALKFAESALTTGPLLGAMLLSADGTAESAVVRSMVLVSGLAIVAKLGDEVWLLHPGRWPPESDLGRTARLLIGPLAVSTRWRFGLGACALVGLGGSFATLATLVLALALAAAVAGELIERYQFFVASVAPRMPGDFRR